MKISELVCRKLFFPSTYIALLLLALSWAMPIMALFSPLETITVRIVIALTAIAVFLLTIAETIAARDDFEKKMCVDGSAPLFWRQYLTDMWWGLLRLNPPVLLLWRGIVMPVRSISVSRTALAPES